MKLTPTKLKELCQEFGLSPSKKYGQIYLINDAPIEKMINASDIKKSDTIVEIGPGFGVLTFVLARRAKKVVAYEIERKIENYWAEKAKEYKNIEIVWGNFLKEFENIKSSYKVVANLPYQITSHALRVLLEAKNKPEQIVVMVQKEVAERICAKPGKMSILAVSIQYYGEPKIVTKVPRGNFWPSPKVDSAVLSIKNIKRGGAKKDENFFEIVRAGFANKRKQLWKNLSVGLKVKPEKVKKAVLGVTGNEKVRAEELSVEDWVRLCEKLS